MLSLAQLPEPVISILNENAKALWAWVSEQPGALVRLVWAQGHSTAVAMV